MPLRYFENIGNIFDNSLTGTTRSISLGSHGNDVLSSVSGNEELILSGGAGNDIYRVATGSATTIADLGGGIDRVDATSMSFANSVGVLIDGRHLFALDVVTNTQVIIIDWTSAENTIETIQLSDRSFSTAELSVILPTLPGYFGNYTWEQSGALPAGFITSDANEAITFYRQRNLEVQSANDLFQGTSGHDSVFGYEGNDSLFGADGNDTLNGNLGDDLVLGGNGNDDIQGGRGNDSVNGNFGNDTVNGNIGTDTVHGGQGEDFVRGGQDNDDVNGNLGNDTIYGDSGNDLVRGGQGNDIVEGGIGNDSIYGDKGDDILAGGEGNDYFHFTTRDHGRDVVTDFVSGIDFLMFSSELFATSEAVIGTFSSGIINTGDGTITLTGIQAISTADIIIF